MARLSISTWLERAAPLLLVLWIAGILFPFEWPSYTSAGYRRLFHTVFFAQWTHETTHFILYFVLGVLLSWWLGRARWPVARRHPLLLLVAIVLAVAVMQEGLQLVGLGRGPGGHELLDVAVDLAGAAAGVVTFRLLRKRGLRRERE